METNDTNLLAELINANGRNNDCGGMNNWFNNPFMYLIWLAYMGNGGLGFGNNRNDAAAAQAVATDARFNQLSQQIADNQSANTINAGIMGNHDFLHSMQNAVNMGFAGTNAAINQASMTNVIGQKDAQAQMSSCCCDIKTNILNQTNQLQSQIAQLANGVQTGFAQVGFLTQQQTNELNTNATANTQRILDHLCSSETQSLRDKLAQASQDAQTATLIASLKTSA